MDLANMIADASVQIYKKECIENACIIKINMHDKYKYEIQVIPLASHVIIKYKTLEYKIAKADKDGYESIIQFLLEAIHEDVDMSVSVDIEHGGYWPDHDENYDQNFLRITKSSTSVFFTQFKQENMEKDVARYMKFLRFLN